MLESIRKTTIMKSSKPLNLYNETSKLKEQYTEDAKRKNWELLVQMVKKFGVKVSKELQAQLQKNDHEAIEGLIKRFHVYHESILEYPNIAGPEMYANRISVTTKSPEMMILDTPSTNAARRLKGYTDHQITKRSLQNPNAAYTDFIHMASPVNRAHLKPLQTDRRSPSKRYNYGTMNSGSRSVIQNPDIDRELGYHIHTPNKSKQYKQTKHSSLTVKVPERRNNTFEIQKAYKQKIYSLEIKQNTLIENSQKTIQFLLESLAECLSINMNQALVLLSKNMKFFLFTCVNGLKDNNFNQIVDLFRYIADKRTELVDILAEEVFSKDNTRNALNMVKCGLYSKNLEVVVQCCSTLTAIFREIQGRDVVEQLQEEVWSWFIEAGSLETYDRRQLGKDIQIPLSVERIPKRQNEICIILNESGIRTLIRALHHHHLFFADHFLTVLSDFCDDKTSDILSNNISNEFESEKDYLVFIQTYLPSFLQSPIGNQVIVESGFLGQVIEKALVICTPGDSGYGQGFNIEEKQICLMLLVEIWEVSPSTITSQREDSQGNYLERVLVALKKGCQNSKSRAIRWTSIMLMFHLLHKFAGTKDRLAPQIYKILTFILINGFNNDELREVMLMKFMELFKEYNTIPILILLEPLLKHILLNLDKIQDDNLQVNQIQLLPSQLTTFILNTIDFHFLTTICYHPKLMLSYAIQLFEIACTISIKQIAYARASFRIISSLMHRFSQDPSFQSAVINVIRKAIKDISHMDTLKMQMYERAMAEEKELLDLKEKKSRRYASKPRDAQPDPKHRQSKGLKDSKQKNQQGEGLTQEAEDLICDRDIFRALAKVPDNVQDISHFQNLKNSERMLVAFIEFFVFCKTERIMEFTNDLLIETYTHLQKKYKLRNNGIRYLLQRQGEDLEQLLAMHKKKQIQKRADKIREEQAQKLIKKSMSKDDIHEIGDETIVNLQLSPPIKKRAQFEQAGGENEYGQKESVDMPFKKRAKSINIISASVEDASKTELKIKKKRKKPKYKFTSREIPPPQIEPMIMLYDISSEPLDEQMTYFKFVKKLFQIYKVIYNKYAIGPAESLKPLVFTFDSMVHLKEVLNLHSINRFLNEFQFSKYEFMKQDEIKHLIKMVNLKLHGDKSRIFDLEFEGFIEFMLQLGNSIFGGIDVTASIFMPKLFERMRMTSLNSPLPLFQGYFDAMPMLDQSTRQNEDMIHEDPNAGSMFNEIHDWSNEQIQEAYDGDPSQRSKSQSKYSRQMNNYNTSREISQMEEATTSMQREEVRKSEAHQQIINLIGNEMKKKTKMPVHLPPLQLKSPSKERRMNRIEQERYDKEMQDRLEKKHRDELIVRRQEQIKEVVANYQIQKNQEKLALKKEKELKDKQEQKRLAEEFAKRQEVLKKQVEEYHEQKEKQKEEATLKEREEAALREKDKPAWIDPAPKESQKPTRKATQKEPKVEKTPTLHKDKTQFEKKSSLKELEKKRTVSSGKRQESIEKKITGKSSAKRKRSQQKIASIEENSDEASHSYTSFKEEEKDANKGKATLGKNQTLVLNDESGMVPEVSGVKRQATLNQQTTNQIKTGLLKRLGTKMFNN